MPVATNRLLHFDKNLSFFIRSNHLFNKFFFEILSEIFSVPQKVSLMKKKIMNNYISQTPNTGIFSAM